MVIKKFLKRYGWLYIPGILFLAINSRIQTLSPTALGDAIDMLEQPSPDAGMVWRQAGLILLIALGVRWNAFCARNCL